MRSVVEQPPANAADGIAFALNASLCDNIGHAAAPLWSLDYRLIGFNR